MKTGNFARVGFYAGGGAAMLLFLAVWMLPIAYLAGALGSAIFGSTQIALIGLSMVIGVLVAGIFISVGGALTGWVAGVSIDAMKASIAAQIVKSRQKQASESGIAWSGDNKA